jgi:hypothetical protein
MTCNIVQRSDLPKINEPKPQMRLFRGDSFHVSEIRMDAIKFRISTE